MEPAIFFLYAYIFILGSCIGSFLNVLVYRIPAGIPFWKGRSHCPACGRAIRPYDMVPVFNWFYLKGRCRDCGARISPRYPGVEAAGGILAVWCFFVYRTDPARAVLSFLAASLLLTIALIDWDTMEIPDGLNLSLAALAVFSAVLFPEPGLSSRMLGMVCVSLPMYLFCFVIDGAFGGGDIKLLGAMGFFLGWKALVSGAVFGFFFGGLEAIYLLATGKARRGEGAHMAFGPALCAGLFLAELYGEAMISWYFGLFS